MTFTTPSKSRALPSGLQSKTSPPTALRADGVVISLRLQTGEGSEVSRRLFVGLLLARVRVPSRLSLLRGDARPPQRL